MKYLDLFVVFSLFEIVSFLNIVAFGNLGAANNTLFEDTMHDGRFCFFCVDKSRSLTLTHTMNSYISQSLTIP